MEDFFKQYDNEMAAIEKESRRRVNLAYKAWNAFKKKNQFNQLNQRNGFSIR
jgi:hypothetical protein